MCREAVSGAHVVHAGNWFTGVRYVNRVASYDSWRRAAGSYHRPLALQHVRVQRRVRVVALEDRSRVHVGLPLSVDNAWYALLRAHLDSEADKLARQEPFAVIADQQ